MTKKGYVRIQGAFMTAVAVALMALSLGIIFNYEYLAYVALGIFAGLAFFTVVACLYVGLKLLIIGEER